MAMPLGLAAPTAVLPILPGSAFPFTVPGVQHQQAMPQKPANAAALSASNTRCPFGSTGFTPPVEIDATGKGTISLLQEFVQSSRGFHLPPKCPILHWEFTSRLVGSSTLEFRAAVGFLLDGVPHYTAGAWLPSKKAAQRDAAEGALNLFVESWGGTLTLGMQVSRQQTSSQVTLSTTSGSDAGSDGSRWMNSGCSTPPLPSMSTTYRKNAEQVLETFCHSHHGTAGARLEWTVTWTDSRCEAILDLNVYNVPHRFSAGTFDREHEARRSTSCRVLWYLRHPDFIDMYEVDPVAMVTVARKLPPPPSRWMSSDAEESALHAAERKTTIMRLQNRLQQVFGGQLKPGERVWEWSFEYEQKKDNWPTMCRASIHVPAIGRDFHGSWSRGQRDAQIDACAHVAAFLDGGHDQEQVTQQNA